MKTETKNKVIRAIVIILIILLTASLFSCSKDSVESCDCRKEVYEIEQYICYGPYTGLPQLCHDKIVLESESVSCQDEYDNVSNPDGTYTRVVCD